MQAYNRYNVGLLTEQYMCVLSNKICLNYYMEFTELLRQFPSIKVIDCLRQDSFIFSGMVIL